MIQVGQVWKHITIKDTFYLITEEKLSNIMYVGSTPSPIKNRHYTGLCKEDYS
jgi:hypothetical protein